MKRQNRKNCESIGAKELATQIAMIRDECHHAVEILSSRERLSEAKLAECVRLTDSLEATNRFLKFAVASMAIARRKTRGPRTS
jgi:hypothetical protein